MNIKNKHWLTLKKSAFAIKLVISFLILSAIFYGLKSNSTEFFKYQFLLGKTFNTYSSLVAISICVALMPINWLLESIKWQYANKCISPITFWDSFMAILCGLSISTLMPNRTGEFAGRILFIPFGYRLKSAATSIFCSFAQFTTTIFWGALIFGFMSYQFLDFDLKYIISAINIWVAILILILFFSIGFFANTKFLNKKWKNIIKPAKVLNQFTFKNKLILLGLSHLRFFVFNFQLIALIFATSEIISIKTILISPVSLYFNTIVPSLFFANLGVREIINFQLSNVFLQLNQQLVLAGLMLWFINIFIPSIVGIIFIFRAKLFPK